MVEARQFSELSEQAGVDNNNNNNNNKAKTKTAADPRCQTQQATLTCAAACTLVSQVASSGRSGHDMVVRWGEGDGGCKKKK